MARRWTNTLTSQDVTPQAAFMNRRQILAGMGGMAGLGLAGMRATTAQASGGLEPNAWDDITQVQQLL